MSTAIAERQPAPKMGAALETVLIQGDLARLTPDERIAYYRAVCESVGLNPLTQPFQYLTLNGKLLLYARRDATDQLRRLHSVSIVKLDREVVEGVYAVTAHATTPDGRADESIGAVVIDKLQGEARANAIMKAETKAKRRVTLSICGLGMLDETEVETAQPAAVTPPPAKEKPKAGPPADGPEFEARVQKVDTIAVKEGLMQVGEVVKAVQALGLQRGWGTNLVNWPPEAFREGGEAAKAALRHARDARAKGGPAPAGDAELVGPRDVDALDAELTRTGQGWPDVQTFLRLPKMSRPEDLAREQLARVMGRLKPLADAPKK